MYKEFLCVLLFVGGEFGVIMFNYSFEYMWCYIILFLISKKDNEGFNKCL